MMEDVTQWLGNQSAVYLIAGVLLLVLLFVTMLLSWYQVTKEDRQSGRMHDLEDKIDSQGLELEKRKRDHVRMQMSAHTDPISGALSHQKIHEELHHEFERAKRYQHSLALMVFQVDHLTVIRDSYGAQAGNLMLKSIVESCSEHLRSFDRIGRCHGDEFAVLLIEIDANLVEVIARRLQETIAELAIPWEDEVIHPSIALGVTALRASDGTPEELLIRAQELMHRASTDGEQRMYLALEPVDAV